MAISANDLMFRPRLVYFGSGNGTTTVVTGACRVFHLHCSGAIVINVYDATSASGTPIRYGNSLGRNLQAQGWNDLGPGGIQFSTGLTVVREYAVAGDTCVIQYMVD